MAVEPGTPAEREGERIREAAGRIYLRHGGATETALAELWAGLRDIGGERLVRSGERLLDRERRARERWARR